MTYTVKELVIIRNILSTGEPNTAKDKVKKYKIIKKITNALAPYVEAQKEMKDDEEIEEMYKEEE